MQFCPKKYSPIIKLAPIILFTFLVLIIFSVQKSYADDECKNISNASEKAECYEEKEAELQKKLDETKSKLSNTLGNISNLSNQLTVTQSELDEVQNDIDEIKNQLDEINSNLKDRNEKLSNKISFRNRLLRSYSKKSVLEELELFFTTSDENQLTGFQYSTFLSAFNKATNKETLSIIGVLNSEIRGFEQDKKSSEEIKEDLEKAQNNLVSLKNDLANKKASAEGEAGELEEKKEGYEEELEELQAKITAIKYGEGNGTVGDYDSPTAKTPDPPFKPAFAAFSYGAYTHYKGMSQYGARGRAEEGDSYEDILEFYYKEDVDEKDLPDKICVEGYGNIDFQRYLYGIAEMPSDWHEEALKAQAVAARSYAYRYAKQGKCICTTQSCQVFSKSKSDNPPSRWKDAVDDTEDKVLDGDVVAYYSSTTGGYIDNIGWDIDGKWPNDAYEKKGGSPWFYKAWYTKSYSDGSTCGHAHPWLKESEMADIVNAYIVYTKGTSDEKSHVSPLTTDCWGGEPYSEDKMREKAEKYGGGYSKVTSIDVDISNSGYTVKVYATTDKGEFAMDGQTFKTVFNLRAPSYVAIRSRLFDFERRN